MEFLFFDIKESQRPYVRHWLIILLMAETFMLIFNHFLYEIYLVIAFLFFCGFLLRMLKLYPGQSEPLILDFSAVVISLGYAWIAQWVGLSLWRFLLIFCSSAIIMPHFVFILREK